MRPRPVVGEAAVPDAVRRLLDKFDYPDRESPTQVVPILPTLGAGVSDGAHVHLERAATQNIAAAGEAISWDLVGVILPEEWGSTLLGTNIIIPKAGYYNVAIITGWDTFTEGGNVKVQRTRAGATEDVWPPVNDPGIWTATDGALFEGVAPAIPCQAGDILQVILDPDDAAAQDLASAVVTVYLVDTSTAAVPSAPDLLWLDAADFTSAGVIASWTDKSGGGNTPTAAGAGRPSVVLAELNTKAVVRFDGVDERMTKAVLATTSAQPITTFAVAKNTDAAPFANDREIISCDPTGGTTRSVDIGIEAGAAEWYIGNSDGSFLTGGATDTAWHIFEAIYNGASSVFLLDGVQVASGNADSDGFITELHIGGRFTDFWEGDIAEIQVFSGALSTGTRDEIRAALETKWGL